MFSPVLPHITEEIYMNFYAERENSKSIHISNYLNMGEDANKTLIENGNKVIDILSAVRQFKSENNVSLKTFIKDINVSSKINNFIKQAEVDLKAVCSINEIDYKDGDFNVEIGEIIPDEQ